MLKQTETWGNRHKPGLSWAIQNMITLKDVRSTKGIGREKAPEIEWRPGEDFPGS